MTTADRSATPLGRLRARVVAACARLALAVVSLATLAIARLGAIPPRRRLPTIRRLAVTVTFHNEGWLLSHIRPLALCGFDEVVVITDRPGPPIEGVRYVCPPSWASRAFSRAAAKLLWMIAVGWRDRPSLYMGYHLFPGGMTALIVGRLLGGGTCYQQTGGAIEILGGGYGSENALQSRMGRASRLLERLALALTREFDRVVVRGSSSRRFLAQRRADANCEVITGSYVPRAPTSFAERPYDCVFVGRLAPVKQPLLFLRIVESLMESFPELAALIIGDGPEAGAVERRIAERGLGERVSRLGARDDVGDWLVQSKVFVQTSRSEALSIAVAEAMGCGTPVVVSDVGDLGDLVENGVTGWRVDPQDVQAYTERISQLLSDPASWSEISGNAVDAARALASLDRVASRWRRCLAPWITPR